MMKNINFFEEVNDKLNAIVGMPEGEAKDKAYAEFWDSLSALEGRLFAKYCDAKRRNNDYINFDECPDEQEAGAIISCLKEYGISRITVSSGWSHMIEGVWALCQNGFELDGMVEINGRSQRGDADEFDKIPAFLLSVSGGSEEELLTKEWRTINDQICVFAEQLAKIDPDRNREAYELCLKRAENLVVDQVRVMTAMVRAGVGIPEDGVQFESEYNRQVESHRRRFKIWTAGGWSEFEA